LQLKARNHYVGLLLLLVPAFAALAQGDSENAARLFKRYGQGAAYNRVTEDVLTLVLSVTAKERARIAVRVCSKEPLPFALATASADPFHVAELLIGGYGYRSEQVIFLRSEDCLSAEGPLRSATEIWTLADGGSLPSHVEALTSNEVKLVSLGKRPANRGVRDYKSAIGELIRKLRANPASKGVVFGYFLKRPGAVLQRRLREVTKMLEQSGLPPDRYLVGAMNWNDEVSTYPPDTEPRYPTVSIVEVATDTTRRLRQRRKRKILRNRVALALLRERSLVRDFVQR
jgi:hypothetical protein